MGKSPKNIQLCPGGDLTGPCWYLDQLGPDRSGSNLSQYQQGALRPSEIHFCLPAGMHVSSSRAVVLESSRPKLRSHSRALRIIPGSPAYFETDFHVAGFKILCRNFERSNYKDRSTPRMDLNFKITCTQCNHALLALDLLSHNQNGFILMKVTGRLIMIAPDPEISTMEGRTPSNNPRRLRVYYRNSPSAMVFTDVTSSSSLGMIHGCCGDTIGV